jgi:hypothetical protein
MAHSYDVIIIGSGRLCGGIRSAQLGLRTAN